MTFAVGDIVQLTPKGCIIFPMLVGKVLEVTYASDNAVVFRKFPFHTWSVDYFERANGFSLDELQDED